MGIPTNRPRAERKEPVSGGSWLPCAHLPARGPATCPLGASVFRREMLTSVESALPSEQRTRNPFKHFGAEPPCALCLIDSWHLTIVLHSYSPISNRPGNHLLQVQRHWIKTEGRERSLRCEVPSSDVIRYPCGAPVSHTARLFSLPWPSLDWNVTSA